MQNKKFQGFSLLRGDTYMYWHNLIFRFVAVKGLGKIFEFLKSENVTFKCILCIMRVTARS